MEKRQVPSWDEYFMRMANLVKIKSKDRSTQVGAVIVDETTKTVLSEGYNGFPRGVNDDVEVRHERPAKYAYTEHAERNAVYAAAMNGIRLYGSTIYIPGGGLSCTECSRAIIQSGIKVVIGMDRKFEGAGDWAESYRIGEEMMLEAGLVLVYLDDGYVRARAKYMRNDVVREVVNSDTAIAADGVTKIVRPTVIQVRWRNSCPVGTCYL